MASRQDAAYGGYDFDFVGEVADRYNCQICTKVIREPHLAVCCGQHFCESCLNEWFDRQRGKQSCPHCRAEGEAFHHVILKGLKSEVNQLEIRCSNHKEGCEWTGELGQLDAHLSGDDGCGFVFVMCPNKCGFGVIKVYRKDVSKHVDEECDLRPYKCEYCGEEGTYRSITGGQKTWKFRFMLLSGPEPPCHQEICPEAPLTCPNECRSESIKRKDMESHRSKCPMEPMECPFAEAGCKEKLRRNEFDNHVSGNQQQHLLLLMKDYGDTKKRLLEMEGKFTTALQLLRQGGDADKEVIDFFITCSTTLKQTGDSIQLVMPKFSEYRRSGKVWHSPPFYYREGLQDVSSYGIGKGAGTHVSLSLLLLKGEYDDKLKWPMKFCNHELHNIVRPFLFYGSAGFLVSSDNHHRAVKEHKLIQQDDRFCGLDNDAPHLVNDCLTLKVQFESDCYLDVHIS